jgi:hypothetical protein
MVVPINEATSQSSSYFYLLPIQGALGLTIILMLVAVQQTTYRSVSFKIIKDIL